MDSSSDDFEIDLGDDKSEINDDSSENEASESEEDYQQNNQVEDEDDMPPTQDMLDRQREANIKALVSGSLEIARKPLIPKLLHVDAKLVLHRPFKTPHPDAPNRSEELKRHLIARKVFVPWGANQPFKPLKVNLPQLDFLDGAAAPANQPAPAIELPAGIEPLVLWAPPPGTEDKPVIVDNMLTRWLRPHQREGVQFMFECVTGLRSFDGHGCILADDMGLGKTLQGISLLWTLLNNGHDLLGGQPLAKRIVICCPTSLVSNWDSECTKWLNGRVRTLPLQESSRDDVIAAINTFLHPSNPSQLLIASYETFRIHAEKFQKEGACDLLICDEAHRLKNDATLTNQALAKMACKRRVLLSGTPLQNQLQEFYAMVNFCNPGVLGNASEFRKRFENPVLAGREPDASDSERALGAERSDELSTVVNDFILRRTNTILSEHLPPKVVELVCCRMTPLQHALYCHYLESKTVTSLLNSEKSAKVLSAITSLRKLLNHPKLIYDMVNGVAGGGRGEEGGDAAGFKSCAQVFPPGMFDGGRGGKATLPAGWENLSGKFAVVSRMLALLREQTKDRVVVVSNFTQTLDLFSQLCRERNYPCLRLDGSTSIKTRQKLVKQFNDLKDNQFVFLLSSKAGGCGLNLVGGNRLILFDMSWNPADDKQAAARVWRDGQRRRVYTYRMMTTGTIEEKIYQRQISKEGLQQVVDTAATASNRASSNLMSSEELRNLFSYDGDTLSTTYDHMVAGQGRHKKKKDKPLPAKALKKGAKGGKSKKKPKGRFADWDSDMDSDDEDDFLVVDSEDEPEQEEQLVVDLAGDEDAEEEENVVKPQEVVMADEKITAAINTNKKLLSSAEAMAANGTIYKEQVGEPKEEDLAAWGHHSDPKTVPDDLMNLTGEQDVSFVFSCQVKGRDVPLDAPLKPLGEGKPVNHGIGGGGFGASAGMQRRATTAVGVKSTAGTSGGNGAGGKVTGNIIPRGTAPRPKQQQQQQPMQGVPGVMMRKSNGPPPPGAANVHIGEAMTSEAATAALIGGTSNPRPMKENAGTKHSNIQGATTANKPPLQQQKKNSLSVPAQKEKNRPRAKSDAGVPGTATGKRASIGGDSAVKRKHQSVAVAGGAEKKKRSLIVDTDSDDDFK